MFLASPSDVGDERELAFKTIAKVQNDPTYKELVTLEPVAWDRPDNSTPMLAAMTPQEAIKRGLARPSECDIVVVILWSRMGTPLTLDEIKPMEYRYPTGTMLDDSRYLSGTEWEYVDAMQASRVADRPIVLVYRRTEPILLNPDAADFIGKAEQCRQVKIFFDSFTNPDGSIRQGYNSYSTPSQFGKQFEQHLRKFVAQIIKEAKFSGQIANPHMAAHVFDDYQSRKSANTRRRHGADLALFASYLNGAGLVLDPQTLQTDPAAWVGVTWGIVEGYKRWMVDQGYAVASVNSRISTIKTFAQLAFKAGAITETEAALIRAVEGYSHKDGRHLDAGRSVTRRSVKKASPVTITAEQAKMLKSRPDTPQGRRDALLMCLLLDHGLRCGEVAGLEVISVNLKAGEMTFYRSKVDKVQTHKLTADTFRAAWAWFNSGDAPAVGPLLRASQGKGAGRGWKDLGAVGMSERAITKRVRALGQAIGLVGLSAHDCRHYWATRASRAGVDTLRLMQAGGWTSPAMPARYVEASKIANEGMPGVD